MVKQRIIYIDLLKGFSIFLVVWFHTAHPSLIDYSFRMPLFFLASAIFFKTTISLKDFISKKFYQLIIPYFFFYTVYYIYLMFLWRYSYGSWKDVDFSVFWQMFDTHHRNDTSVVNPPLWFIMALLNMQILQFIGSRLICNRLVLLLISVVISLFGFFYVWDKDTYFMFGRALPYYIYYCFGNLYGKDILEILEKGGTKSSVLLGSMVVLFTLCAFSKKFIVDSDICSIIDYFEITSLVILFIYIFKYISDWSILKPLYYFGSNSYVVLGMHDMILTIYLIAFHHFIGAEMNIVEGGIHVLLTFATIYPIILMCNKFVPYLVGKKNVFELCRK